MDHNYTATDIQKYILNELNEMERSQFENAISKNSDLAKEVQFQIKITEGIEYAGAQDFKTRTKYIYQDIQANTNNSDSISVNKILSILGIISVISVSLLLLYNYITKASIPKEPTIEVTVNTLDRIFASNFQTYDWNPNQRDEINDELQSEAFSFYKSNSFEAAIPLLEKIVQENEENIPCKLALASSYVESGKPELAVTVLKQILGLDDMLFQDQANWNLALVNLRLGDEQEAIRILKVLTSDDKADHYTEALNILSQLEE